jgi:hypothetical protein
MNKVFSVSFWTQTFLSTMMTIFIMYILKVVFAKVNVPVVSDIVTSV